MGRTNHYVKARSSIFGGNLKQLWSILGNSQRLDGGAMFGNAPKALWTRWITPDSENRIPLACRTLLVKDGTRHILFETGIGLCFPPAADRFGVFETEHVLLNGLEEIGLSHTDIDVVVLSHMHFDHAGGLLTAYEEGAPQSLLFPNATYIVGKEAWDRALTPHYRDKASFLPHLNRLLEESGRLHTVSGSTTDILGPDYTFHQPRSISGLLLTEIAMPKPNRLCRRLDLGYTLGSFTHNNGICRYPELPSKKRNSCSTFAHSKRSALLYP